MAGTFSVTVLVARILLTRDWLRMASERWEVDPCFTEVPPRLLSSHSWKKVMADTCFVDDDIPGLEARALVKAAEGSAHSPPVHDHRILSLSDNLSNVLCFNRGRSRDFRLLTQIRRFASVCLEHSGISIRWIPSEVNSSDRKSREHDSEYDATKSLVDLLGSNDGQTFPLSQAWLSREPGSCEHKAFAASDGVAIERNLFPETLSAVAEETENSLCTKLAGDENQGPGKTQPRHDRGLRESSPSTKRLRRIRPRGTRGGRNQQFREQQRRGERIRGARWCLAATRTCLGARTGKDGRKYARGNQTSKCIGDKIRDSQGPGIVCNIRSRLLRQEWLVCIQQCGRFGSGQTSHGMNLLFSEGHRAWKGKKLLASVLFFFPTFSQLGRNRLARSFRALKGWKKGVSEFFVTTAPSSSLERSGCGYVQDRWYAGGCAHPGHVRRLFPTRGNAVTQTFEFPGTDGGWSPKPGDSSVPLGQFCEKQNWRGGRHGQFRLTTMSMGGSCVREASATTATRQAFAPPE